MRITLVALAITLSGCSHAYVAQWDKEQVTACCPTEKVFCTEGKLLDLAKDRCGGDVSLLGGGSRGTGGLSVQRNMFNNSILGVSEKQETCEVFKCEARGPASK